MAIPGGFSPFFTISGELESLKTSKPSTLYYQEDIKEGYIPAPGKQKNSTLDISLGVQKSLSPLISSQLGIIIARSNIMRLSGDIWDDDNSKFSNHVYQYKFRHQYVGIKSTVFVNIRDLFSPYLSASIGIANKQSYHFQTLDLLPQNTLDSNFNDHTSHSLSYTLGAGLQKGFSKSLFMGIGYQFSYWGTSRLGGITNGIVFNRLTTPHTYTNAIQLSLTYLIN